MTGCKFNLYATRRLGYFRALQDRNSGMRVQRNSTVNPSLVIGDAIEFLASLAPGSVDLIVSSPPYCMGKEYDTSIRVEDFIHYHERLLPLLHSVLKPGGNLCWQ